MHASGVFQTRTRESVSAQGREIAYLQVQGSDGYFFPTRVPFKVLFYKSADLYVGYLKTTLIKLTFVIVAPTGSVYSYSVYICPKMPK